MKKKLTYLILLLTAIFMAGCTSVEEAADTDVETAVQEETKAESAEKEAEEEAAAQKAAEEKAEQERLAQAQAAEEEAAAKAKDELFSGYTLIEVDGGDLSGHREANVVVDIGFGDREYWAFTNEHGQLVRVVAAEIILQDDDSEPVTSDGRYYPDEAKVPDVESDRLDEGHIIADALGGVANAYNITPQESTLNRHGDQAYMEDVIRDAGGADDFEAIITYPDTETQVPSRYQYTYTVRGNKVTDKFDNLNPDEVNASLGLTGSSSPDSGTSSSTPAPPASTPAPAAPGGDVSSVDTNGNGQVTIKEAKAAGFSMPIHSDHWLYPYMDDRDGDGMVGE
ncbi:DNA/RNA non-specific endonuclease [Planococcus beigongshangi]|uniref:DNA/RNA non-specific endonuclease n=1 Tax=Planococcus beigongshangi TaxID=2782536 RepID=UPI00193B553D|nr:DNA/RNA non-specific endonuclease [Planococcus beigongshangi]